MRCPARTRLTINPAPSPNGWSHEPLGTDPMMLLSRLVRAAISLLVIVTLVFVALRATGDPILAMFNPDDYTKEALDSYRRQYGYDGTILEQYISYIINVAQG